MKNSYSLINSIITSTVLFEAIDDIESDGHKIGNLKNRTVAFEKELSKQMSNRVKMIYGTDENISQQLVEGYHELARYFATLRPDETLEIIKKVTKEKKESTEDDEHLLIL